MLSGLADQHIKSAIVAGLRLHGMDVVTTQDLGFEEVDDEDLLSQAVALNRLLLTNDHDFLRIDAEWATAQIEHHGIIFWQQAGLGIGEAIRRILAFVNSTAPEDAANHVKFL